LISENQLIKYLIQKFNVDNIRKVKIPLSTVTKSTKNDIKFYKTIFKSAVGSLIFLSRCIRSDITFAAGKVSRNSENSTMADWKW